MTLLRDNFIGIVRKTLCIYVPMCLFKSAGLFLQPRCERELNDN